MFEPTYLYCGIELRDGTLDIGDGLLENGDLTLLDGSGKGRADEGEEKSLGELHVDGSLARVIKKGFVVSKQK
ncbi:hypothetical protein CTA1_3753 [Colletotrichum tanaceti]|uniref:Uncharacterized protein n=1 Tax=Colletotrichum tanaceti TaxID=1306861 RepID=A0A4V6DJE4_9PEZI|nr:hypothetical protein CTA1_3753 [Colletotrichum tanaceti]